MGWVVVFDIIYGMNSRDGQGQGEKIMLMRLVICFWDGIGGQRVLFFLKWDCEGGGSLEK